MSPTRNRLLLPLLLAALAGSALLLSGCSLGSAAVAESPSAERGITVLGRGSVSAKPDLAQASLGVETFAPSVADAVSQNNTKMNAVMARLKELGIAEKDIQTANFSIGFERQGPADTGGQYRVSNMVQVKIRDLDKVGAVLDAGVQAGVNQMWGVSFAIEEQTALEAQARSKGMEDARARAEALAKLTGVQLGPILKVSEGGMAGPLYGGGGYGKMAGAGPISPGEVEVSYQVQVTYAIE